MKNLTILLMTLAAPLGVMSQARVGLKAGWNLSNVTYDNLGSISNRYAISGFNAGVVVDLPLVPEILSIQSGAFYTTKGTVRKIDAMNNSESVNDLDRLHSLNSSYIEMPLNFVGKVPIKDNFSLFAGAGPYVAFHVNSRLKLYDADHSVVPEMHVINEYPTPPLEWIHFPRTANILRATEDLTVRKIDWGMNAQVGAELNNFLISVQYGFGFEKVFARQDRSTDDRNKNRVLSVSVGYLLGHGRK